MAIASLKRNNNLPGNFSRSTTIIIHEKDKEDSKSNIITISNILEKSLEEISLSIKQQQSQAENNITQQQKSQYLQYVPILFGSIIQYIWGDIQQFFSPISQNSHSNDSALANIVTMSDVKLLIFNPNSISFIPNLFQNKSAIVLTIIEFPDLGVFKISFMLDSKFSKSESELFVGKIVKYLQ